ncbi:MAG: hypothetical protein JXB32_08055 [Deltaproteobacteria bacterium]|nr:hypothetical protein [Deltaproteobacteria bacterium]
MAVGGARGGRGTPARLALLWLAVGCGHDWSAADTGDANDAGGGDGDVAVDEGSPVDAPDASDDALRPEVDDGGTDDIPPSDADEGGVEDVAPEVPTCTPGAVRCSDDAMQLLVCDPETGEWSPTVCSIACVAEDRPHCAELVPSNLPAGESWMRGTTDVTCTSEILVFVTTDGAIYRLPGSGEEEVLRNPGEGEVAGIPFAIYEATDDPSPVAAWSLRSLDVGEACLVVFVGGTGGLVGPDGPAAALLLETDAMIRGRVAATPGLLGEAPGTPGPGGGAGGAPGLPGGGPGGGMPGSDGPRYNSGGSGGGGFGGHGGRGATIRYASGGPGGPSYGTAELVPLVGGSGGAGGVRTHGGWGGGGGGALQISAQGSIRIPSTGRIDAGGGGGSGGHDASTDAGSGGGGGSGGAILLEAAQLELDGIVATNGGGGGGGASHDAGADGTPGEPGGPTTAAAPGGFGIADGTDGGGGSDVANPDGQDGTDGLSDLVENGGGGGGAAGRIRLNIHGGFALSESSLSPGPATGLATTGTPSYR